MPGYFICVRCGDPFTAGMEQLDENDDRICPTCFLKLADDEDFEVPKKK